MSNRTFNQFRHSLEKKVVDLFATIKFGAAGAPTLSYAKGVTSISRGNTGLYIVKLMDTYTRLLEMHHSFVMSGVYAKGSASTGGGTAVPAPAAPACFAVASGASYKGGFGIAKLASCIATNKLTIAGVDFTAIANAGSPTGNQWCVGTGDTADVDSANALAAAINSATDAALVAAGVSALSLGANVIILATKSSVSLTKTGATITLTPSAATSGGPGMVLQFNAAGTAADPASGEEARLRMTYADSTAI